MIASRFATSRVSLLPRLVCALALLVAPSLARAQFNGPVSAVAPGQDASQPTALTTDRAILFPPAKDLLLTPGDLLSVRLFGQPDYANSVRIGMDGTVLLPLIGVVDLTGLSVSKAELLIASDLKSAGMYLDPQVTLQVVEGPNAVATLVGEVHGVVPIVGTRRLLDVLSVSGGLPSTASHIITINRPTVPQPIIVDLGNDPLQSELANIPIFPGDTIVVGRLGVVYMLGSFKGGGVISLTPYAPLTLIQATALIGGVLPEAKYSELHIIRTVGNHRTVVKLNLTDVEYGRAPDPILQPNDIVFLPASFFKQSLQNGSAGILIGLASLVVTLGLR